MATKPMKRMPRPDDAKAFVDDLGLAHDCAPDTEAESFGEEFIATATSGDNAFETARDELVDDELFTLGMVEEDDTVEPS